jgi:hypothetical protein
MSLIISNLMVINGILNLFFSFSHTIHLSNSEKSLPIRRRKRNFVVGA